MTWRRRREKGEVSNSVRPNAGLRPPFVELKAEPAPFQQPPTPGRATPATRCLGTAGQAASWLTRDKPTASVRSPFPRLQGHSLTTCTPHPLPEGSSSTVSNASLEVGIMRFLMERRKPGPRIPTCAELSCPLQNPAPAFWFLSAPVLAGRYVSPRPANCKQGHEIYHGSAGALLPRCDSRQHN